jgi:hypothetical protein
MLRQFRNVQPLNLLHQRTLSRLCNGVNTAPKYGLLWHVPGNLTAVWYRDEILQLHLMHVIDRQRELFQQEYARPHTARLTMDYLAQNDINVD